MPRPAPEELLKLSPAKPSSVLADLRASRHQSLLPSNLLSENPSAYFPTVRKFPNSEDYRMLISFSKSHSRNTLTPHVCTRQHGLFCFYRGGAAQPCIDANAQVLCLVQRASLPAPATNGISCRWSTIAPIINSPPGSAGSSDVPSGSWSHDLVLLLRANCFSVVLRCQCYHGW